MKVSINDSSTDRLVGVSDVVKVDKGLKRLTVEGYKSLTHPNQWLIDQLRVVLEYDAMEPYRTIHNKVEMLKIVTALIRKPLGRDNDVVTLYNADTRSVIGICGDYSVEPGKTLVHLSMDRYLPTASDTKFVLDTLYDRVDSQDALRTRNSTDTTKYIRRIDDEISYIIRSLETRME